KETVTIPISQISKRLRLQNTHKFHHIILFFFSSRRRHTRWPRDWSSDVCSSDLRHDLALYWGRSLHHGGTHAENATSRDRVDRPRGLRWRFRGAESAFRGQGERCPCLRNQARDRGQAEDCGAAGYDGAQSSDQPLAAKARRRQQRSPAVAWRGSSCLSGGDAI